MKKRKAHFQFSIFNFQWLIALVLAFASCADKDNVLPAGARGVSINVTLPDDGSLSRSVPTAPEGHALRCVLEARAKDDNTLKARVEQIAEGTASLSLKFDLEAAGEYTVVLWADYIAAGTTAMDATLDGVTFRHYPDKYYKTDDADGLQHVFVITPYNTYTTPDVRDAFTGTVAFTKGAVAVTDLSVSLTRPLSRVTIAEKNAENFALCSTVTATYKVPAAINALTGELVAGEQTDVTLSGTPSPDATVTVSGTPCHILLSDLVLATADGTMGTIALDFTATPEAAVDHYLPPLTIPAGVPARRAFRVNAAGNLIAPTDPLSRVILAVDIDDSWGTHDVEKTFFIPDANFRQFCIDNGYADADGHIILAEAAKVTELFVDNEDITSLEGIEYFTGMTYLGCDKNQLSKLDISKCVILQGLDCSGNQLSTLNLTECTTLEALNCSDNPLNFLDVSRCTTLTILWCNNTSLIELDMSGYTELKELECSENPLLSSLNVSGCTTLETLECKKNPNFTKLEVSKCTRLEELYCSKNPILAELDVSGCTGLAQLYCEGCSLTELDVSGCTELTSLYCYNNRLSSLDVSKCTKLEWLLCHNNLLSKLDVSMTLNPNPYYYLYCGNQSTEEGDPQELTLTLTAGQQTRWNSMFKNDEDNRNVTVKQPVIP